VVVVVVSVVVIVRFALNEMNDIKRNIEQRTNGSKKRKKSEERGK
jgi:hypothetical protein